MGGMFFALVHFCALRLIATTHPTCVFPSLAYDTHIVGHALDVLFFCDYIKTFSAIDKVCCMVSIRVRPIYITSFRLSYI